MKDSANDLAAIATMVDVGSVWARTEDFLHERLVACESVEPLEKAAKAQRLYPGRTKLEALPAPNLTLSPRTSLPEGIDALLCRLIDQEAGDRLTISNVRAHAKRGSELTFGDGH